MLPWWTTPNFWFINLYGPMERNLKDTRRLDRPSSSEDEAQPPPPKRRRQKQQPRVDWGNSRKGGGRSQFSHWDRPTQKGNGKGNGKGERPNYGHTGTNRAGKPVPQWQQLPPNWGDNAKRTPPIPPDYPSGQAICFNFHSEKGCNGRNCHRNRNFCPKLLRNGSYCHEDHCLLECERR